MIHTLKPSIMKLSAISFLIIFGLTSCASVKESSESSASDNHSIEEVQEEQPILPDNLRAIGKVFVSEGDCPLFIRTDVDGNKINVYPINLPDKYQEDGLQIDFEYRLSRAPQPAGCSVKYTVSIESVSPTM